MGLLRQRTTKLRGASKFAAPRAKERAATVPGTRSDVSAGPANVSAADAEEEEEEALAAAEIAAADEEQAAGAAAFFPEEEDEEEQRLRAQEEELALLEQELAQFSQRSPYAQGPTLDVSMSAPLMRADVSMDELFALHAQYGRGTDGDDWAMPPVSLAVPSYSPLVQTLLANAAEAPQAIISREEELSGEIPCVLGWSSTGEDFYPDGYEPSFASTGYWAPDMQNVEDQGGYMDGEGYDGYEGYEGYEGYDGDDQDQQAEAEAKEDSGSTLKRSATGGTAGTGRGTEGEAPRDDDKEEEEKDPSAQRGEVFTVLANTKPPGRAERTRDVFVVARETARDEETGAVLQQTQGQCVQLYEELEHDRFVPPGAPRASPRAPPRRAAGAPRASPRSKLYRSEKGRSPRARGLAARPPFDPVCAEPMPEYDALLDLTCASMNNPQRLRNIIETRELRLEHLYLLCARREARGDMWRPLPPRLPPLPPDMKHLDPRGLRESKVHPLILANVDWFESPIHVAATTNDPGPYEEARAILAGTPTDLSSAWYTVRSALAALIPELQLPDVVLERIKEDASPSAVTPLTYQQMTKLLRELLAARKATAGLLGQILRYEAVLQEVDSTHVLNLVDPRIDALQALLEELDDASANVVHLSTDWRRKYGRKFFVDSRLCLGFGMKLREVRPVLVWKQ